MRKQEWAKRVEKAQDHQKAIERARAELRALQDTLTLTPIHTMEHKEPVAWFDEETGEIFRASDIQKPD